MLLVTRRDLGTWCSPCDSPLLCGSFVFLNMGPYILFLVFPLFLGALVTLWLAGFHHISFLSEKQKCGLQPSKCWWSAKGTWQWLAETPRAKVLWLSSMVGLQSDATAEKYRQTHRAKEQGTSHMHLRYAHTDKLVILHTVYTCVYSLFASCFLFFASARLKYCSYGALFFLIASYARWCRHFTCCICNHSLPQCRRFLFHRL